MRDLLIPGVIVAGIVLGGVLLLATRPVVRKLAFRNILRRRTRVPIIVAGLMIGTAIIAASLVVGDTLDYIFVDDVYVRFHNVDEYIANEAGGGIGGNIRQPFPQTSFFALRNYTLQNLSSPVDGFAPALLVTMPVQNLNGSQGSPAVLVVGYEDAYEDAFGPLLHLDGSEARLSDLGTREAYVNERAVRELNITAGDSLRLVYDSTKESGGFTVVTVREIVQDYGKANWEREPQVFLDLGEAQRELRYEAGGSGLINMIRVSNVGDVATGVAYGDRVTEDLKRALIHFEYGELEVWSIKAWGLSDAASFSGQITEVFLIMGAFSIVAGVLLIVNLFVLLSEERRGEMGIARAVVMQRAQLLATFAAEGTVYAVFAAAIGAMVGLGLGYLIVYAFATIFPPPEVGMVLRFHFDPASLALAFLAGVIITFVSVTLASAYVSRLNIVRAIRDVPEPPAHLRTPWYPALGGLLLAAGIGATALGLLRGEGFLKVVGPPAAFLGLATALVRLVPPRYGFPAAGAGILWWILAPVWARFGIVIVNENTDDAFVLFIATGLLLVLGAVLIVVFAMPYALKAFDTTLGSKRGHPVLKTAVSYPVEKRFRTGMTLAMFALTIFTVTVIAEIQAIQEANLDQIIQGQTGGFDIVAYTNNYSAVANFTARLQAKGFDPLLKGGVLNGTASATIVVADVLKEGETTAVPSFTIFGVDNYLLEANTYGFYRHADSVRDAANNPVLLLTDADVWRALQYNTTEGGATVHYAVIDRSASGASQFTVGIESRLQVEVGDRVNVSDARGGNVTVEIIGILEQAVDFTRGLFTSADLVLSSLNTTSARTVYFFQVAPGVEPSRVTAGLRVEFLLNTVNLNETITQAFDIAKQVLLLIQAYLAIGLLVGIAGLVIITIRAVVERRQQIGVLRAIGFTKGMVARTFLFEISFIAVLGTVIGVALGVLLAYQVYNTYFRELVNFAIPYAQIAGIVAAALAATLFFTAAPALRASKIPPAEALRYIE